jgi:VWFA-related protein
MSARRVGWIYLFCFSLISGYAQRNGPPAGGANRDIALDVVVTNKAGKPVSGLQPQDFTLLDNKKPVKIVSIRAVESRTAASDPVEVILFVDGVNTSFADVAIEEQAVEAFLKKNSGQLPGPTSIVLLSTTAAAMANTSSRDGNALIAALNQGRSGQLIAGGVHGYYGIDGSQQLSLYTLNRLADFEAAKPGRKLLIWISPGWPLLSGPDVASEGLSSKEQQELFTSIVAFSDKLRQARIALYDIDPSGLADADELGTSFYGQFTKGVKSARQVQIGNLGLQVLAEQSGGRVLNSSNDVAGEIATCLADASAYYVLSFEGLAADGPNDYHALEIKIGKPGLTARARTGYYAQPAQH